ncbi:MAG TPA: DUF2071 domain-containing protein [Frankiaceae bacterium]|nr:DUF2071 domain-containing protein [Frankiaceae bacterium]
MVHRWEQLTFLHWPYDPAEVQALLPDGLTVETYEGRAWVGLVPFHMTVRAPGIPPLPWLSRFPETNVRTYVTGPGGVTGVWFFSLDASRLPAVLGGRALNIRYCWSRMRLGRCGDVVRYVSTRRWPGPRKARNVTEVEAGAPYAPGELTDFDHWLTARFRLWTVIAGRPVRMQAHHPPWQLRRATVKALDTGLLTAAGLTQPTAQPITHFADGTEVLIGLPRR